MTRTVLTLIAVLLAGYLFPGNLPADVLLIQEVRQTEKMDLPVNGMSKADVEARYGEPARKRDAVGDPPIVRWEYDRWSVYFEYDLVLFTVLHKGEVVDSADS